MEQQAEDRYDSLNGILVCRVGMTEYDDHTRLFCELCALINRLGTASMRVQTHALPTVKMLSAREAAIGAGERRVVKSNAESRSSSSLASKKAGKVKGVGRGGSMREERNLRYGEARDDGSRRSRCREPNIAVSFAKSAESTSDSGSSGRVHGRVTYREKNVLLL